MRGEPRENAKERRSREGLSPFRVPFALQCVRDISRYPANVELARRLAHLLLSSLTNFVCTLDYELSWYRNV